MADLSIVLERPKSADHGDFATNLALVLAKPLKQNPRMIATQIIDALPASEYIAKTEIAGAGFINFFLNSQSKQVVIKEVLKAGHQYGRNKNGNQQKVQVEFVSANPTGPLHVGHGRGAAVGDCLARLLDANGWDVTREFYYNDAGAQIANLALSVQARARGLTPEAAEWPADGYRGDYISDIAQAYLAKQSVGNDKVATVSASGDVNDLEAIRCFAVASLRCEQDLDLQAFGVRFDNYYLESSLYSDGRVEAAVQALTAAGKTYESEGALWLRSTDYGDDKDRVMRKSEGGWTYFVPDVAYHITKWERGFQRAINIQGSDHHGTIARVRAGLMAVGRGIPAGYPDYVLHKMVTVMRSGEEVKISKRAGSYVTLRDLIDEVGRDATRFFLASRKADSEFVFDIDLAKSQSEDNPVYYVQYAHARICSVLQQAEDKGMALPVSLHTALTSDPSALDLSALQGPRESALLSRLGDYPEMLHDAAQDLAPHQLAFYLRELAGEFHAYYNAERVLVPEQDVRVARLGLLLAVRQVLRNGLALLGVSAPDKM